MQGLDTVKCGAIGCVRKTPQEREQSLNTESSRKNFIRTFAKNYVSINIIHLFIIIFNIL